MTCQKHYWGTCFQQLTCITKKEEILVQFSRRRQMRNSCRNGNQQSANVKNGGKIVFTWSFLPFAFHVYTMLNLSIDAPYSTVEFKS